jgi:hypothetical protein
MSSNCATALVLGKFARRAMWRNAAPRADLLFADCRIDGLPLMFHEPGYEDDFDNITFTA